MAEASARIARSTGFLLLAVVLAAMLAYLVATAGADRTAIALVLLPLSSLLFFLPRVTAVLLGASIPFVTDLTSGAVGLQVVLSDIMLVLIGFAAIIAAAQQRETRPLRALRGFAAVAAPFVLVSAFLVVYTPTIEVAAETVQRYELILLVPIAGAALAVAGHGRLVLQSYVVVTSVMAVAYLFVAHRDGGLGLQKNAAGMFFATALLIVLGYRPLRRWILVCGPLLAIGLVWTGSRGAVAATFVGLFVLVIAQRAADARRILLWAGVAFAFGGVAFLLLPDVARDRFFELAPGTDTNGAWANLIRLALFRRAWADFQANLLAGTGVGQAGEPHNLLLRSAAEGGLLLLGAVVILAVGGFFLLWRWRRRSEYGAIALAAWVALFVRAMLDTFWVRGTPTPALLLLGMSAAGALMAATAAGGREPGEDDGSAPEATTADASSGPRPTEAVSGPREAIPVAGGNHEPAPGPGAGARRPEPAATR